MASIKNDPQLTAVDKAIRRINRDLKRAASFFGTQSSQYGEIAARVAKLLDMAGVAGLSVRHGTTATGETYDILPRSRAALSAWTDKSSQQLIQKMERSAQYKKQEQWYIERYKEQHGGKLPARGVAGRQQAVREMSSVHIVLNNALESALGTLYSMIAYTGDDDALVNIRKLSRGQWTTAAAKREMIRMANDAIREQAEIDSDFLSEIGIDVDNL